MATWCLESKIVSFINRSNLQFDELQLSYSHEHIIRPGSPSGDWPIPHSGHAKCWCPSIPRRCRGMGKAMGESPASAATPEATSEGLWPYYAGGLGSCFSTIFEPCEAAHTRWRLSAINFVPASDSPLHTRFRPYCTRMFQACWPFKTFLDEKQHSAR